jgi:hypothetical protein
MPERDGAGNDQFARTAQVAKYHLSGYDARVIARLVGCSVSTAWKDIQTLRAHWLEQARGDFAEHQAQELARVDMLFGAALMRNDLRSAIRCAELRCRLLGLIGPKVAVVAQGVQLCWDAIQGAAEVPDVIEERLAQESIPHLEAKLNGHSGGESPGAGAAAGGE